MRLIIKQFTGQVIWSQIFCVGTNACTEGGQISNTVLEKMKSQNIIQEVHGLEIIEIFHNHEELMKDNQKCKYFEIKLPLDILEKAFNAGWISKK